MLINFIVIILNAVPTEIGFPLNVKKNYNIEILFLAWPEQCVYVMGGGRDD